MHLRWTECRLIPTLPGDYGNSLDSKLGGFNVTSELNFVSNGRFVWDEAKYPTMSPLKEIMDSIHQQVSKIEDDLKVLNKFQMQIRYQNFKPSNTV